MSDLVNVFDPNDRGAGAINNGDPQSVVLSGREYERYLCGALNEPPPAPNVMIRKRLSELLKQHNWYAVGNLGVPGMLDQLSYKCYCGWQGDDPHGHVADSITSGIGLHEDQYRSAFAADDCDYDKVRYSTPWLDVNQ